MNDAYGDRAAFVLVYIREAHAADEWVMDDNTQAGICIVQPRTAGERAKAACALVDHLAIDVPTVVDDMDDSVGRAYGAWPERIYVVDPDGRIGYQGGYGPFHFEPAEAAAYLESLLGPPGPSPTR